MKRKTSDFVTDAPKEFWMGHCHQVRHLFCDGEKNHFGAEVNGTYFIKYTEPATEEEIKRFKEQTK